MSLNRKEFITTASTALLALLGRCPESKAVEVCKSVKIETIHHKDSLVDRMLFVRQAGFDAVEVNSQGYCRKEMLAASKYTGLKVATVYHGDNWTQSVSSIDDAKRLEAVRSVLESISIAEYYGAEYVQLMPGIVNEKYPEASHESLLRSLQDLTTRLKRSNVKILVQNFSSSFFNEPKYFSELFSTIKSDKVGLCLDLEYLDSGSLTVSWSELLKNYPSKIDFNNNKNSSVEGLADSFCCANFISLDIAI